KGGPLFPTYTNDAFISANGHWLVMKNFNPELRANDGFKLWNLEKDEPPIQLPIQDAIGKTSDPQRMLSSSDHRWLLTIDNNKGTLWDLSGDLRQGQCLPANMA